MARLTIKDIKNLHDREKVTIQTYGHIPIINIQGPVHRPLYMSKTNIRALVIGGYDVRLYEAITNKPTDADIKDDNTSVTTPNDKQENSDKQEKQTEEKKVEPTVQTIRSAVSVENSTNIIYTYDDLKNKSNKELKEILTQRKVTFTTTDRNELIALIVESNPTE